MKKILFSYMFLLLIGCNEKRNIEEYSTSNINLPDSSNVKLPIAEEEITWREETVGDISFKISNNFKTNISNKSKKLYINEKDSTALTIDIAQLPEQHKNSILEDLINDTEAFGKIINEDNKRLFNDFKLVSSRRTHLGNIRCIEVIQTSTKVSSSNTLMYVVSYFAVSYPYYYSIVFSYPYKAQDGNIDKIKNSFQLNSKIEKSTDELITFLNDKSNQIESNINTIKSSDYKTEEDEQLSEMYYEPLQRKAEPYEGYQNFIENFSKSISLPKTFDKANEIRVKVSFNIKKDGSFSNVKVRGTDPYNIEPSVISALQLMPKWKPALHNGKVIEATYILPIIINVK